MARSRNQAWEIVSTSFLSIIIPSKPGTRDEKQIRSSLGGVCGGELALLVDLALVRGLDFISFLHGNFLALLAGLDLARIHNRKVSPYECVYMENFQYSWERSRVLSQ